MLESLLYVSRSALYMPDDEEAVRDIVRCARIRNHRLQLTGALMFTHQHFAQYIEGPEAGLADVMASIRRDSRHSEITIVASRRQSARRFSDWDMAYAGPSDLIASRVERVFGAGFPGATTLSAERLVRLMLEFAQASSSRSDIAA